MGGSKCGWGNGSIWFARQNLHVTTEYDNVPIFPLAYAFRWKRNTLDVTNEQTGNAMSNSIEGRFCLLLNNKHICWAGCSFQWHLIKPLQSA